MIDKNIFFLHIPRTMGTTLKNIFLTPYYQAGEMLLNLEWPSAVESAQTDFNQFKFISGHLGWNIESVAGHEWNRIIMLRDPHQRSWSMWNFIQEIPKHYLHKRAKGMSLLEFAESPETSFIITNMQARYIANRVPYKELPNLVRMSNGDPNMPGALDEHFEKMLIHLSDEDLLEAAKANIDRCLFVGISEMFYESIHEFWLIVHEQPMLVSKGLKSHFHPLTIPEGNAIQKLNQVDLSLYRYAMEKLFAKIQTRDI